MKAMLDRADTEVRFHKEPHARRRLLHLAQTLRETVAAAAAEARLKDVRLSVRVEPRLAVNADPEYLASALANLLGNAIKFTPAGGTVRVRGLEKDQRAVLEVEDECGGLPPGKISELFEPFTQKGADRSGLGLGLAIARRAVALNDGALGARDIPGKGCVFTITLPLAVAARTH
jgi:signal transduction histidine kinase